MPAIVGNIKINAIGSSGVFHIGDVFYIAPKSTSKTFAGSGSFITGDFQNNKNGISSTNTYNPHLSDSNVIGT